jgi:hypothetical protein
MTFELKTTSSDGLLTMTLSGVPDLYQDEIRELISQTAKIVELYLLASLSQPGPSEVAIDSPKSREIARALIHAQFHLSRAEAACEYAIDVVSDGVDPRNYEVIVDDE